MEIGASVLRERPDTAFDRAESLIDTLTARLRAAGVAEQDIVTRSLSLDREFRYLPPRDQFEPPPAPEFAGWRARHFLTVKLRDFSRLGRTVSESVAALEDAGELQGIVFSIENIDPLIDRARDEAALDAREKAKRIAARLGVRVGTLVYARESFAPLPSPNSSGQPFPFPTTVRPPTPPAFPGSAAPITGGQQSVIVTIEAHFSIAPAQ